MPHLNLRKGALQLNVAQSRCTALERDMQTRKMVIYLKQLKLAVSLVERN
jgi:hypothetical protein